MSTMPPGMSGPPSTKILYTTPSPWEAHLGYHRAVRHGPFIFVSGTTALRAPPASPSGSTSPSPTETYTLHHPDDAYRQTLAAFAEALQAVAALDGKKADVVRVRMYVRDQRDVDGVGSAFSETFGLGVNQAEEQAVGCAATMVVLGGEGGGGFVDPGMLVEVEVDAVVL